jgi:hypothetical protein
VSRATDQRVPRGRGVIGSFRLLPALCTAHS